MSFHYGNILYNLNLHFQFLISVLRSCSLESWCFSLSLFLELVGVVGVVDLLRLVCVQNLSFCFVLRILVFGFFRILPFSFNLWKFFCILLWDMLMVSLGGSQEFLDVALTKCFTRLLVGGGFSLYILPASFVFGLELASLQLSLV